MDNENRVTCEVTISNRNGLHARPAAMFVKISSRYRAELWVQKDEERVNGKSIMGLMMLAAGKGSKLILTAEGADDAPKVIEDIRRLVESGFDEE
ncbi:MAG: HPr family phosphocarrier protein [Chthoniobacterales bacterium]